MSFGVAMAVILYQIGTQQEINGLRCNTLRINSAAFDGNLTPGWFFSPEDAYRELEPKQEKEIVEHEEAKEETKTEVKAQETKVLKGNAKIRDDARQAGIKNWEKARISTLREKLKA